MDKKKLEEARSIITSALTPNNKKGMTAIELEEEIYALMGSRLALPPGCPNLDAFIQRFLSDEFCAVPTYGGSVYKLIPKADTDYLLRLVARQNDSGSKPLYVAEQAKAAAKAMATRGRSSRGGRGGTYRGSSNRGRGSLSSRLGPPRLTSSLANSYVNAPPRAPSSMGWAMPSPLMPNQSSSFFPPPSPSFFPPPSPSPSPAPYYPMQRIIQQAPAPSNKPSAKPPAAPAPAPTPTPTPTGSAWESKFRDVFARYKACKDAGKPMELVCRIQNSKSKLAGSDFPTSLEELFGIIDAFVGTCTAASKEQAPANVPLAKTTSAPLTSEVSSAAASNVLTANSFPAVGKQLRGTIVQLSSFEKFFIQLEGSSGKVVSCPCTLYGVKIVHDADAVKAAKEALLSCGNKVDLNIKAHAQTHVEVDLFHIEAGGSLISYFIKQGFVVMKAENSFLEPPPVKNLPLPAAGAPVVPTTDQLKIRVSAVVNASTIAANLQSNLPKLIEIEEALSSNVKKSKVRAEDVVKNAVFVISAPRYSRCRVIDGWNNSEAVLRLIDHGTTATISTLDELFPLPDVKVVTQTSPLAFFLSLSGLLHDIFKNDRCTSVAEQELLGKVFEARVTDRKGRLPSVELFYIGQNGTVDISESANEKLSKLIFSQLKPTLTVGSELPALTRFIDWISQNGRDEIRLHMQVIGVGLDVLMAIEEDLPKLFADGVKPPTAHGLSLECEYAGPYLGAHYRCRLLANKPDKNNCIPVLFYDYGNIEQLPVTDLRFLEQKYSTAVLPPQAYSTRLSGLPPSGKQWVGKASDLIFASLDSNAEYAVKIVSVDDDGCIEIVLKLGDTVVNETLANMSELFEPLQQPQAYLAANGSCVDAKSNGEAASSVVSVEDSTVVSEAQDKFVSASMTLPPFSIDKSYDPADGSVNAVITSFTAPATFACQLLPNDDFNEMITQMQTFYELPFNRIPPAATFKPGDVGVVHTSGVFCRAQVITSGRYSNKVWLVDYASTSIVNKDKMFLLESRFAGIPAMAFELQLDDVPQSTGTSPSSVVRFGDQLATDCTVIKVLPSSAFVSNAPSDAVITVPGKAKTEQNVFIGAQLAALFR